MDINNVGQFTIMGWFLPFIGNDGYDDFDLIERNLLSMPDQLYITLGAVYDNFNNHITVYDHKSGRVVYGNIPLSIAGDISGT
jgi:hypothetical protein